MDNEYGRTKSAPLASIISAIIPGSGFIYLENYLKGFSYMLIFISLIVLLVSSANEDRSSMLAEILFFALLLAVFYIFQIIDTFNEAQRGKMNRISEKNHQSKDNTSLSSAIIILTLGVLFQLRNLNVLSFEKIVKFWPLILIGIGIKIVIQYYLNPEKKNDK